MFRRNDDEVAWWESQKGNDERVLFKEAPHKLPVYLKPENNVAYANEQCED